MNQPFLIQIQDLHIPIEVHRERRRSVRFAVGKTAVLLRLPDFLNQKQINEQLQKADEWVHHVAKTKPQTLQQFREKTYINGQILTVNTQQYQIFLTFENRKSHSVKIDKEKKLLFSLMKDDKNWTKAVETLLSRIVAKDQKARLEARVNELNRQHFQEKVNAISLKYNTSNWGSCSGKGNLNFSTRLLFAPDWVQDYIIIHELAHLKEMNHSDRFWAWVQRAMPDYEKAERWLKQNSHLCYF